VIESQTPQFSNVFVFEILVTVCGIGEKCAHDNGCDLNQVNRHVSDHCTRDICFDKAN